jgi:hypothetical protein
LNALEAVNGASKTFNQIVIQECENSDIPGVANFLGRFWFSADMSNAQRLEFTRLENNDLTKRYGSRVGRKKYNSTLLVAMEDEEIVGYAFIQIYTIFIEFLQVCWTRLSTTELRD